VRREPDLLQRKRVYLEIELEVLSWGDISTKKIIVEVRVCVAAAEVAD